MWVEEKGYQRRGLGEGRGEGDLAWNISSCRHQWQSLKEQVKVWGHVVQITLGLRQRPLYPPPLTHTNWTECLHMCSTLWFHDTMQVANMDSTAVTTVYVCGYYVEFRGHMQNNVTACQNAQCVFQETPRERDRTTWVYMHVCEQQRVSHIQWRQTGHQSDTQGACRSVNKWTTTGNWHNISRN